MVLVSHSMDLVQRFCERVIFINGGRLVDEGPPAKIIDEYMHMFAPPAEVAG